MLWHSLFSFAFSIIAFEFSLHLSWPSIAIKICFLYFLQSFHIPYPRKFSVQYILILQSSFIHQLKTATQTELYPSVWKYAEFLSNSISKIHHNEKLSGRRSDKVKTLKSVNEEARIILKSGLQNSERTCRQIPHGEQKSWTSPFLPPTMQIAENDFSPSLTALKIAVRSAQTVAPKEEFSILQPPKIFPVEESNAAPTLKFE